jgi:hypothetical protein
MRLPVVASIALVAGLVAGAAVAQAPVPGAALAGATSRSCARLEVSSGAAPARVVGSVVAPAEPSFSVARILDLTLTVLLPAALDGEHVVELRVFTPDAQLYRSMAVPFARGARPNAVRAVEGYARPVPQQALGQVSRGSRPFATVSAALPVGGTDIVSSGLYGRWRVEAYLDGAQGRCGPAAVFNLRP